MLYDPLDELLSDFIFSFFFSLFTSLNVEVLLNASAEVSLRSPVSDRKWLRRWTVCDVCVVLLSQQMGEQHQQWHFGCMYLKTVFYQKHL